MKFVTASDAARLIPERASVLVSGSGGGHGVPEAVLEAIEARFLSEGAPRDLTLVQTTGLSIHQAVDVVQEAMPDGIVFWAIPTIRETRAGYGVYVYGSDGAVHYFFIS